MSPTLEISFWTRLLGILALEIGLVVAFALAVQLLTQSAFWRRTIWQICFVCLLLLGATELTGFGRGLAVWISGKPVAERKFFTRIVPLEEQFIPQPVENEIAPVIVSHIENVSVVRTVWWPGMIWLAGLGLIVARILFARCLFFTLRFQREKINDPNLLERVSILAKRLGIRRKIHLLESNGLSSPMTFGITHPSIGLPSGFAQTLNSAQQDAMLTHELAHLAARDPFWYLIADLAAAFLWWHPLVWFARRRLHSTSELAADEAAAILENGPGTLAECLVQLGQQLTHARSFGWLGVDGNGFRSHLGQRVERLLNLKEASQPSRGWKILFAKTSFTILFAAIVIFTSGWIQNKDEQRPTDWKSALQQSWNTSFASLAVIAISEKKTDSTSQSTSPDPAAAAPEKHSNEVVSKETLDRTELVVKKQILVIAKIFTINAEASKALTDQQFGIPEDPAETGIISEDQVGRISQFLEKRSGVELLGMPRAMNNEGHSAELSIGQQIPGAPKFSRGISLSILPKAKGESNELDFAIRIGEFSENGKLTGKPNVDFKTSVLVPLQQSAVFLSGEKVNGGTNYLVIVTPSQPTPKEMEKMFPKKKAKQENAPEVATLVQDGKLLFEMGKFGEAEVKLNEALKIDAENKAATYYMSRVKEAKEAKQSLPRVELIRPTIPPTTLGKTIVDVPNASTSNNSIARDKVVHTSKGRQAIKAKLDRIRLSEVRFENLPLGEVLKSLRDEAKKRDPDQVGINFIFNPHANVPVAPTNAPNAAARKPASSTPVDINEIVIHISPALENVRMLDVLDAITRVSKQPLEYRIEDYAVVFSPKASEAIKLYTRVYKLDSKKFLKHLGSFPVSKTEPRPNPQLLDDWFPDGGVTKTNLSVEVNMKVRKLLEAAGVGFDAHGNTNGRAVFFNDRSETLMVRTTLEDLEKVQNATHEFTAETPQITIETKFVEIDEAASKALGFDWLPENTLIPLKTNRISSEVLSLNGSKISPSAKNPLTNSLTTIVTGILTDRQYRTILKNLEKRGGADILSAPKVTTLSGRQTQISVLDLVPVMTGVNSTKNDAGVSTNTFETQTLPFGPVLDVLPSVSADGFSIEMTIIASVTEFLGYDKPEKNKLEKTVQQLNPTAQIPLPRFRLRQATTSARVWDGQTIILGGMMDQADETKASGRKNLLVFVTATIIDPAGNRVNAEENMPFATNSVPKQLRK